jgi:hypothetical protein
VQARAISVTGRPIPKETSKTPRCLSQHQHRSRPRPQDATFNPLTSAYIAIEGFTHPRLVVAITEGVLALRLILHAEG